jgi:L-amino acid N-acyltransferase YncA
MESPGLTLRRATDDDWPAIWPIWHAIVAAGESYSWSPDTDEATARGLWMQPEPAEVWVAADERGQILGTALMAPNRPSLGAHVANAGFMVDPAAGGKGVGRALGLRILERARELGYLAMQFNAVVSTNTRAVALWESLGFAVVGTIPEGFRHSRLGLVDLHIMHRRLDA